MITNEEKEYLINDVNITKEVINNMMEENKKDKWYIRLLNKIGLHIKSEITELKQTIDENNRQIEMLVGWNSDLSDEKDTLEKELEEEIKLSKKFRQDLKDTELSFPQFTIELDQREFSITAGKEINHLDKEYVEHMREQLLKSYANYVKEKINVSKHFKINGDKMSIRFYTKIEEVGVNNEYR